MSNNVQQKITTLIIFSVIFKKKCQLFFKAEGLPPYSGKTLFGPDVTDVKMTGSMELNAEWKYFSSMGQNSIRSMGAWHGYSYQRCMLPRVPVFMMGTDLYTWGVGRVNLYLLPLYSSHFMPGGKIAEMHIISVTWCCKDPIHKREDTKFISCPKRNNSVNISERTHFCASQESVRIWKSKSRKITSLSLHHCVQQEKLLLGKVASLVCWSEVISNSGGKSKQKVSLPIIRTGQRATAPLPPCLPQLEQRLHHIRIFFIKISQKGEIVWEVT